MTIAKEAIRDVESPPPKAQHDLQDDGGASSTSGAPNMSPFPGFDPVLEYIKFSSSFMEDSVSGVPTAALGGQDTSTFYTLNPSYSMDAQIFGTGIHVNASYAERTLFSEDAYGTEDTSQIRDECHNADLLHREDSRSSRY
jgi:hypothetical protein